MKSKRSHEGYLMIDHRSTDGISDGLMNAVQPGMPPGAGCGLFEAPTITCSHCQTVLIVNPLRTRERAYCAKCDHYICDGCGVALHQTGVCRTMKQIVDEIQEKAALDEQRGGIIVVSK